MAIALNWVGHRKPSQVAAVISESAFASYQQIAHDKMNDIGILRWFRDPFSRWFFDDRFAPQPVIHRISPTPLLIVHGTRDPIVPYHHGLQLKSMVIGNNRITGSMNNQQWGRTDTVDHRLGGKTVVKKPS